MMMMIIAGLRIAEDAVDPAFEVLSIQLHLFYSTAYLPAVDEQLVGGGRAEKETARRWAVVSDGVEPRSVVGSRGRYRRKTVGKKHLDFFVCCVCVFFFFFEVSSFPYN